MTLQRHDARVFGLLVGHRHRRLDPAVRLVTRLGDPLTVICATLVLLFSGESALRAAGEVAAVALAASHLLVQLLKRTIARPRPQLPVGASSLIQPPDRFSFPSGHAAAALSVALGLAPAVGPAAVLVLGVGFAVGVSRCYLGVHYPGDVLAGWLLAAIGVLLGLAL